MTAAAFKKSVLRGMAGSPFRDALTYLRGATEIRLTSVLVHQGTNTLEQAQEGEMPEHVLDCHIPKTALAFRPDQELDRLRYNGRIYKFRLESGDQDFSPVWCLQARSPLR